MTATEQESLSAAFEKAIADQAYRAELLANPAIAGVPGLTVVEDTATKMHLIVGLTDGLLEPAASLLARADTDPEFKARLMADPAGVAKLETGFDAPEGLEIVVLDHTPGQSYIVLPPAEMSSELSPMQLEEVSGGKGNQGAPYRPHLRLSANPTAGEIRHYGGYNQAVDALVRFGGRPVA